MRADYVAVQTGVSSHPPPAKPEGNWSVRELKRQIENLDWIDANSLIAGKNLEHIGNIILKILYIFAIIR